MTPSDDPVALLPMAVAGIVIGMGLAFSSGYGLHRHWSGTAATASSAYATVEGRVEWAGWRASAAAEGPDWYLEVRLAERARGFLVAASSLTDSAQVRYGPPAVGRGISALTGERALVLLDSTLLARSGQHPYLASLRVSGETVVPLSNRSSEAFSPSIRLGLSLLFGVGLLVGIGVLGVSLQHVVVCLRHKRTPRR